MADAEEPSQSSEQVSVCSFFRKPSKNKNIRKRIRSNSDDENDKDDDTSAIESIRNEKKPQTGLSFSTGGVASANKTAATSDASRGGGPVFHFESSREIQVENDCRATATLETETDFSSDARAIRERVLKQAEEALNRKPSSSLAKSTKQQQQPGGEEKVYKGIHGYTDFKAGFRREQTVASEKAGGSHGPLRASAHIRTSVRFDYQPDICKDYKETGYCGYGDSCKFMHDRGDYKSGWQMEREWEQAEKERKKKLAIREWAEGGDNEGGVVEDDGEDEDELPFACFICRNPFQDPVVTKCKHYFCEHCALKHYQTKSKNCFVCNKPTQGIFDTAHDIKKKMAKEK